MRKTFTALTLLLLAWFAMPLLAQAPAESPCPNVNAIGPESVEAKASITITASVSGGDSNVTPTYNWSISDGLISEGQGTSTITIDSSEATSESITATVDVGGYDRECSTSSSVTVSIMAPEADEPPAEDAPEKKPPQ